MKRIFACLLMLTLLCSSTVASAETTLKWWDQFLPLIDTHRAVFDAFEEETGVHVEYQNFDAATHKDSFDLAFNSNQAPDIFSDAWGSNQLVTKYNEGIFSPLNVTLEELPEYVQAVMCEGFTMFDGQVYSFPTYAINHQALLWYNNEIVQDVPDTLDELRELFKSLNNAEENRYALALPMSDSGRIGNVINYIAAASGGNCGFDYTTGRYDYNSDITKAVFQFFVDLWNDGSIHPASPTLTTRTVRERWVNGEAVFAIDGTWYPGSAATVFGRECLENLGVHRTPILDVDMAAEKGMVGCTPSGGTFYVSSSCKDVEAATQLLMKLLDDDYNIDLASAMDQPPLKTEAIAKADVVPSYVEACNIMASEMGYYPEPLVRNQAVGDVYAEMMDITPHVGDIFIGYVTGAITDWEAALDEYTQAMNDELDRAIAVCQSMGSDVSREDWVFANYVPGESYTSEKYTQLK